MGKLRFRKQRGASLVVWPLLLISLGAVFWLDRFSDENFAYWTLPNPLHKNDRLSLGVGHGQVYWAYGWPYVGEQSDGRPIVGSVDGGPGWQNDGDPPLSRAERIRLAQWQFNMMIDSTVTPGNYPRGRIPLWAIAAGLVAVAFPVVVGLSRGNREPAQGA